MGGKAPKGKQSSYLMHVKPGGRVSEFRISDSNLDTLVCVQNPLFLGLQFRGLSGTFVTAQIWRERQPPVKGNAWPSGFAATCSLRCRGLCMVRSGE